MDGVAGNETVTISAFGIEQTYTGVRHIVAQGGLGDDTITLEEGVLATSELWGDFRDPLRAAEFGDDTLLAGEKAIHTVMTQDAVSTAPSRLSRTVLATAKDANRQNSTHTKRNRVLYKPANCMK